jgi:peptidoglycan/LPS O-acetylase OafA/YrhL
MTFKNQFTYRSEIDGLRAVAVLPVILFHAGVKQMSGGYVGVDIFFVISGFLITRNLVRELEAGQFSLLGFYESRARRILPALFLVLVFTVIFGAFFMLPYELATLGRGLVAVMFFLSNVLFWRESGYFAAASELNPLLHTWSLAVEEQYYILFPLLLWACWRWFSRGVIPFLILASLGSFAFAELLSARMPSANFYMLPTRAWELLAGSLTALYLLRCSPPKGWMAEFLSFAGFAAIVFAILTYSSATPFPSSWALLPVLGTVAIIVAASPATALGKLLGTAPLLGIGLISYSAYLWHQPLFAFVRMLDPNQHPSQFMMFLVAGAALVLAWLSWRFVERPFREKGRFSRKQIFAFSSLGAVVLVAIGGLIILSNGAPERFPEGQRPWIETGPLEYGHYVRSAYNKAKEVQQSPDLPKLVLVGDSYSQDFFNIIQSAGAFQDFGVSFIYVPRTCQVHYGVPRDEFILHINAGDRSMCRTRVLSDNDVVKMRAADVVIFASRWQPWSAALLKRSLASMALPGEVIVVGSKSFEKNRRVLLNYDPAVANLVRIEPDEWSRETNALLEESLPKGLFVNILDLICTNGCPLFTDEGALISYDGAHLTPDGVAYLSKVLFSKQPLRRFLKTN